MRTATILGFLALSILLAAASASAMRNPAAVYCTELGYNYTVNETDYGETGYCTLPDGTQIDEWELFSMQALAEALPRPAPVFVPQGAYHSHADADDGGGARGSHSA